MSRGFSPIRSKTLTTGRVLDNSKAFSSRNQKKVDKRRNKRSGEKGLSRFLKKLFG
ncbi:MAG: hypothetical protein JW759_06490 [Candidatus Coatesbacteria bacterium]|nr:hypothetical protein [Candidatus Coatesbacteria bacterium]